MYYCISTADVIFSNRSEAPMDVKPQFSVGFREIISLRFLRQLKGRKMLIFSTSSRPVCRQSPFSSTFDWTSLWSGVQLGREAFFLLWTSFSNMTSQPLFASPLRYNVARVRKKNIMACFDGASTLTKSVAQNISNIHFNAFFWPEITLIMLYRYSTFIEQELYFQPNVIDLISRVENVTPNGVKQFLKILFILPLQLRNNFFYISVHDPSTRSLPWSAGAPSWGARPSNK